MRFRRIIAILLAVFALNTMAPAFQRTAEAARMPYRITVDLTNQIVTIYSNKTNDIVRQFLCSSGAKDATPTGTFTMPRAERDGEREAWFHFRAFGGYARYVSRIYYDVMFHSLLYNRPNPNSLNKQSVLDYGYPVSHGCIRLRWQDAKFIAQNCKVGTKVKIYKSGEVDENLRALLFQATYTIESGQTYREFLGIPDIEGVMGRYSEGDDVRNLQMRLRDLGIFTDEVSGIYGVTTVTAVRDAQKLMGVEQTGVATLEFQQAIYSSSAPSAMNGTLREGSSGPAVRCLQENLTELGMYDGALDSIYDVDVVEAVKLFQQAYGYDTDGVATSIVQKAIYYEKGKLKALFNIDGGYDIQKIDEKVYMGRVNCELGIRMREKTTKESHSVGLLRHGDVVVITEQGSEWVKVQRGKLSGYVMLRYLDIYSQNISSLRYTSKNGKNTYTIGYTAEDYFSGASRPADVFEEYISRGGSLDSYEGMVDYVTVDTESDDITLNLREAPNTSSAILCALQNGEHAKVTLRSDEWTLVEYNGQHGYLLNRYLEFWSGPKNALGDTEESIESFESGDLQDAFEEETGASQQDEVDENAFNFEEDEDNAVEHAVVACDTAAKAPVFREDSEDATVLGSLGNGTKVDVISTVDGWSLISYQGHQGYMKENDLKFVVEGLTT